MEVNLIWQESFKSDLVNNLRRVSNDFSRQLLMKDLWEECIMYSCDMCLHYYKTGPFKGFLPTTIDNITYNVCYALSKLVPEFGPSTWQPVYDSVQDLLKDPHTYDVLQERIDRYYQRY